MAVELSTELTVDWMAPNKAASRGPGRFDIRSTIHDTVIKMNTAQHKLSSHRSEVTHGTKGAKRAFSRASRRASRLSLSGWAH